MKCLACGAEMSVPGKSCKECGAGARAQSFWPRLDDPIFRLWDAQPAHPVRWLAFFFPVAWLAGYGALRASIGLALVFVAGDIAARLLTIAYASGAAFLFTVLVIFYSLKVAMNVNRLVPERGKFNWAAAIGAMVAYLLVVLLLHGPWSSAGPSAAL